MNELIRFETFCLPWEYAVLTSPYYSGFYMAHVISPGAFASAAIMEYVQVRERSSKTLWDSGDFVYGLS